MALKLKSATLNSIIISLLFDINPLVIEKLKTRCKRGMCRLNAAFVSDLLPNTEFVEGLVVLENGFCFEHFWNKVGNNYIDVSAELIENEDQKSIERRYYPIRIFPSTFTGHNEPFLVEVKQLVKEYYELVPLHKIRYDEDSDALAI